MAVGLVLANLARGWRWIALRPPPSPALRSRVMAVIAAYTMHEEGKPMGSLIIVGILGMVAGVVTFLWPGMTALVLLLFIASWAVLMGIFQIAAAIRLREHIEHEWLLGLSGVLSIAFGVLMFLQPGAGALAVIWVIGSYAIFFGIVLIALGFKLKGLLGRIAPGGTPVGAHR